MPLKDDNIIKDVLEGCLKEKMSLYDNHNGPKRCIHRKTNYFWPAWTNEQLERRYLNKGNKRFTDGTRHLEEISFIDARQNIFESLQNEFYFYFSPGWIDSIQRIHKAGGAAGTALKEKKINCVDSLQNIFNFEFDEWIDLTKNKARKVKGAAGTEENGPRRMHQEECTKKNAPRRMYQEE